MGASKENTENDGGAEIGIDTGRQVPIEPQLILVDKIIGRQDARKINSDTVQALANSVAEIGLINPIRIRPVGDRYEVVAGAHRLAACGQLGWTEIACVVVDDDDLRTELAMIDENLCRSELGPAEEARAFARRKAIYEELHPTTKHGANLEGGGVAKSATPGTKRFTAATADAIGDSERAVQLKTERGEKIDHEVLAKVAGTSLDTGTYLDKLKKLPVEKQGEAVERTLSHPKFTRAKPATDDHDEKEAKQVARLMSAWNAASPQARDRFRSSVDFGDRSDAMANSTVSP